MNLQSQLSDVWEIPRYANSGAWMSRTRQEDVESTVLGRDDGFIRCGLCFTLGLKFRDTNPVACLENLLLKAGFTNPEQLRQVFELPAGTLIAHRQDFPPRRLTVNRCKPDTVLKQALMLGLCTDQVYDPARPVMWTETSLTRTLDLFDPRGFYA